MPDDVNIDLGRFAVGQPVTRIEDPVLLRGEGSYSDDVNLAGQAWAAMVRSSVAHGTIRRVDVAAARSAPGVLGVWTIAELDAAGIGPIPCNLPLKNQDGSDMLKTQRPVLARGRVRNVGEPIACVVAETLAEAREAAELVVVDIEPLPAVSDAEAAIRPGAPQLHDNVPGNIALDYRMGDKAAVDAAFAKAVHVTKLRLVNNRVAVSPMEPRSGVGEYDPASERYTLHVCSQGVMGMRGMLAAALLKVPAEKVRVLTGNVGGSFGMKAMPYPEYACCLVAAKALGRPVKWTADRGESFLSDHQGRGAIYNAELALDADGNFLAARVDGLGDMGAYLGPTGPLPQSQNIFKNLPSMYRTPAIDVRMRCVVTNTVVMGAYRGAGRPEGNYIMERL
ncbi:MAG: xanthine dehydrogenase family protein molybdopterin-binding subunit, partial [Alphaproteobacteria bacterium]|nr:xanthine dehydrogenase family protein molybdopterin-binding subunit [Alphaproteobacteria bacterium]